jgi:hypothetical protein
LQNTSERHWTNSAGSPAHFPSLSATAIVRSVAALRFLFIRTLKRQGFKEDLPAKKPGRIHERASSETFNEKSPFFLPIGTTVCVWITAHSEGTQPFRPERVRH